MSRLSHSAEGTQIDRGIIEPHYVVRPIHINLHVILLEDRKLVFFNVVNKWALGSPEVAAQDQKLLFILVF